jgi:GTP-binding protein HflX
MIVSAKDRADVARVREEIIVFLDGALVEAELFVPYARHGLVPRVYEAATVLGESHDDVGTRLLVRAPASTVDRLKASIGG